MKTGNEGINLIKHFESLHDGDLKAIGLQPKMCPAGIWTEGYGHAMRDESGDFLKGIANKDKAYKLQKLNTEQDAISQLMTDLQVYEKIVLTNIKVALTQNQFDSLVSYTYNTGGSQTLNNLINRGASDNDIYNWFTTHYIIGDGKRLEGLVRRRKAEADLYFKK